MGCNLLAMHAHQQEHRHLPNPPDHCQLRPRALHVNKARLGCAVNPLMPMAMVARTIRLGCAVHPLTPMRASDTVHIRAAAVRQARDFEFRSCAQHDGTIHISQVPPDFEFRSCAQYDGAIHNSQIDSPAHIHNIMDQSKSIPTSRDGNFCTTGAAAPTALTSLGSCTTLS